MASRPDASSITDDQLDALYAERDRYRAAWHSARDRAATRTTEREAMAQEVDRLGTEIAEGIGAQTLLKGLNVTNGQVHLEIEPAREMLLILVASMREMLDNAGAENYLTTEVEFPPAVHLDLQDGQHPEDSYTLTVQRRHRPTAHDLRRRAEAERDAARAQVAAARTAALQEAEQIASTVIGPLWHLDTLHEICDRLRVAADPTTT